MADGSFEVVVCGTSASGKRTLINSLLSCVSSADAPLAPAPAEESAAQHLSCTRPGASGAGDVQWKLILCNARFAALRTIFFGTANAILTLFAPSEPVDVIKTMIEEASAAICNDPHTVRALVMTHADQASEADTAAATFDWESLCVRLKHRFYRVCATDATEVLRLFDELYTLHASATELDRAASLALRNEAAKAGVGDILIPVLQTPPRPAAGAPVLASSGSSYSSSSSSSSSVAAGSPASSSGVLASAATSAAPAPTLARNDSPADSLHRDARPQPQQPVWIADSVVSRCKNCAHEFTLLRRRHHCRACGSIFCNDCTTFEVVARLGFTQPVRVCLPCAASLHSNQPPTQD